MPGIGANSRLPSGRSGSIAGPSSGCSASIAARWKAASYRTGKMWNPTVSSLPGWRRSDSIGGLGYPRVLMPSSQETVEASGHLIDSHIMEQIFDSVVEYGGRFEVEHFS